MDQGIRRPSQDHARSPSHIIKISQQTLHIKLHLLHTHWENIQSPDVAHATLDKLSPIQSLTSIVSNLYSVLEHYCRNKFLFLPNQNYVAKMFIYLLLLVYGLTNFGRLVYSANQPNNPMEASPLLRNDIYVP
jgi:hypothetical protein